MYVCVVVENVAVVVFNGIRSVVACLIVCCSLMFSAVGKVYGWVGQLNVEHFCIYEDLRSESLCMVHSSAKATNCVGLARVWQLMEHFTLCGRWSPCCIVIIHPILLRIFFRVAMNLKFRCHLSSPVSLDLVHFPHFRAFAVGPIPKWPNHKCIKRPH